LYVSVFIIISGLCLLWWVCYSFFGTSPVQYVLIDLLPTLGRDAVQGSHALAYLRVLKYCTTGTHGRKLLLLFARYAIVLVLCVHVMVLARPNDRHYFCCSTRLLLQYLLMLNSVCSAHVRPPYPSSEPIATSINRSGQICRKEMNRCAVPDKSILSQERVMRSMFDVHF
jgi:hypothetical protein